MGLSGNNRMGTKIHKQRVKKVHMQAKHDAVREKLMGKICMLIEQGTHVPFNEFKNIYRMSVKKLSGLYNKTLQRSKVA